MTDGSPSGREEDDIAVRLLQSAHKVRQTLFSVFVPCFLFLWVTHQVPVDEYAFGTPLVVQAATLLDINDNQSSYSHHQHGDEPGEFSQNNGEHDKADERHADRRCRQCEEAATDAHELQRLCKPPKTG